MAVIRISNVFKAERQLWLDYCVAAPNTTFFHSPMWAELFEKQSKQFVSDTQCIEFSDGIRVLIPMVRKTILPRLLNVYLSMPGSTYGGWISPNPLSCEHVQILKKYLSGYKNLICRENPFDKSHEILHGAGSIDDVTQVINLTAGFNAVFDKANKNHHRKVKTAQKKGLTVTAAEKFGLWEQYYSVYCESINRWKQKKNHTGVRYDLNFFKEIYSTDSKYRTLWLAMIDNAPVAGILCFYWNRHAVVWLGAGLDAFFDYHPNDLVYHNAIKNAAENGFHWFDCNPSAGLAGVFNFKRSLGSETLQTNYINRKSTLRVFAEQLRMILQNSGKDSSHD